MKRSKTPHPEYKTVSHAICVPRFSCATIRLALHKLDGEEVERLTQRIPDKGPAPSRYQAWYDAIVSSDTLIGYLQNLKIEDNMDDADILREIQHDIQHIKPKQMVLIC